MSVNQNLSETYDQTTPMIIFLKGRLDTLNYFIDHMAANTINSHILCFADDDQTFFQQLILLDPYINDTTYVITFNNTGINIKCQNQNYWNMKHVRFYNIQVDSPIFYLAAIQSDIPNMQIISIDKAHAQFIQKYFPFRPSAFLPHGGILSPLCTTPYSNRDIDILYIGSRSPLVTPRTNLTCFSDNGEEFLRTTYQLLMEHPQLSPEQLTDLYFREAGVSFDHYTDCLYALYQYDLFNIRAYYQEQVIAALAEAHFHVHLYGDNWKPIGKKYPEYLHTHDRTPPQECINLICCSKIVLNIQPWFKEGAHERIYNTMLNEAVCVTDTSEYLKRHFQNGKNIIFYELTDLNALVSKIGFILQNPAYAKSIIQNQKETVMHSTWRDRLQNILDNRFVEGIDFI